MSKRSESYDDDGIVRVEHSFDREVVEIIESRYGEGSVTQLIEWYYETATELDDPLDITAREYIDALENELRNGGRK